MAGSLKRGYPDVDEDLTLIRALVDSNVPKFLADDLPLFAAIVKVILVYRWPEEHINRAQAVGNSSRSGAFFSVRALSVSSPELYAHISPTWWLALHAKLLRNLPYRDR